MVAFVSSNDYDTPLPFAQYSPMYPSDSTVFADYKNNLNNLEKYLIKSHFAAQAAYDYSYYDNNNSLYDEMYNKNMDQLSYIQSNIEMLCNQYQQSLTNFKNSLILKNSLQNPYNDIKNNNNLPPINYY